MTDHDFPVGHLRCCQICGSEDLELIIDLGEHPPCDSLLRETQLSEKEKFYPLRFLRCRKCGLAQIDHVVAPEELFYLDYPYRTGITESLRLNLHAMASKLVEDLDIERGSLVIDIGSNDGTLLQGFKSQGMNVLGVEPTNVAKLAIEAGIPTIQKFFGEALAKKIRVEHGQASVVTAANLFAHVPNLGDLIRGVSELLPDKGIFLTESHYLLNLIQTAQYDTIYHEHLRYYSLKPLLLLMDSYDFTVVDAELIPNYGGSIRIYSIKGKGHQTSDRLKRLLQEEEEAMLYDSQTYVQFRERAIRSRLDLHTLLTELRDQGKRVVGLGCPGRCSTLLNFSDVGTELLPYIAEQSNSLKLGLFLPGKHIPVVDEEIIFEENPDYVLMLPWHYASAILKHLRRKGLRSKVITPLPYVHILEN